MPIGPNQSTGFVIGDDFKGLFQISGDDHSYPRAALFYPQARYWSAFFNSLLGQVKEVLTRVAVFMV